MSTLIRKYDPLEFSHNKARYILNSHWGYTSWESVFWERRKWRGFCGWIMGNEAFLKETYMLLIKNGLKFSGCPFNAVYPTSVQTHTFC